MWLMAHLARKCTLNKIIATNKIIANTGTCKAIDEIIASDKIIAKTRSKAQNSIIDTTKYIAHGTLLADTLNTTNYC